MASSLACDVVILPDETLANKAVASSKDLQQFGSFFTLEDGKCYPHSSLYMFQLNIDDIEQVKTLLAGIATQTSELTLEAVRYDHKLGFVDAEYQRTSELDALQQEVIVAINPVRDGMREKDKARMLEATGLALENYENYGYKPVGDLFRPHITLSRLTSETPEALDTLGQLSEYNGSFLKIGLFEMGDNGTCVHKLGEWKLARR